MNIVVKTASGFIAVRPDTTWERYSRDFYVPDSVKMICWAPVAYTKMLRPGKCIEDKFAHRYYNEYDFAYGILFYPFETDFKADGALMPPEAFAQACCIDHTSILTDPYPEGAWQGGAFSFIMNDETVYKADLDARAFLRAALVDSSKRVLLRNGDCVAMELSAPQLFNFDGTTSVRGIYDGAEVPLFDFNVIK
ncbi:MAG: hypothetical protein IJ151_05090 [Bacteroidales bacterium]|nr:hypothetical protein [Bacteroidales bacterium]